MGREDEQQSAESHRQRLRALIIEDSEDDAALLLRELRRGGYDVDYQRVDTPEAMVAALDSGDWELVISDYVMPRFGGLEALKLLRERDTDLPFILVSGKIGEDIAVESMRSGASDYIIKGNLTRLVPAIEREMREAEVRRSHRHAQQALIESEERYRLIADNSTDLVSLLDEDRKFVYVSPSFQTVLGYRPEELLGATADLLHPDDVDKVTDWHSTSLAEVRARSAAGNWIWMEASSFSIVVGGKPLTVVIARDISERKRAEDALKVANRALMVLSAVNELLVRTEDELSLLRDACNIICNIGGQQLCWMGFSAHDDSKTVRPVCSSGSKSEAVESLRISWAEEGGSQGPTAMAIRTGKPQIVRHPSLGDELPCTEDESCCWGYSSCLALPLVANGEVFGNISMYSDLPDAFNEQEVDLYMELAADLAYGMASLRMREQHELAEIDLAQQREDYETIYDTVPAIILYLDRRHRVVRANKATSDALRLPVDQILGRTLLELFPKEGKKILTDHAEVIATGTPKRGVVEHVTLPDGETRWLRTDMLPYRDREGHVSGVIVFALDITERMIAEQRRKELEEHQHEFYKRTILAATQGKLVIADRQEIDYIVGPPIETWVLTEARELATIRQHVTSIAESIGMDESRLYDLLLCVGEAGTNAVKHGGGGTVSIHKSADGLIVVVSDRGPGIETLVLPEATLRMGYSTANSLGMGYKAIISIADRVYLATGPAGTTVAFDVKSKKEEALIDARSLPDTWVN